MRIGKRTKDIVADRMKANRGCVRFTEDSRQQRGARLRSSTFADINSKYGPEPRKARRGIALTIARKNRIRAPKKS